MGKILIVLILSFVSNSLLSQSPGGVGTVNLRGWFDGSVGITLTGGAVSTWQDRATIGNATQTTAGERPTVSTATLNYNDALRFDGTNDNLDLIDRMASGVTGVSAYAVARQVATSADTWGSVFNGQANGPLWTGGGYGLVALNSGSTLHGFYVRDYNSKGVSFAVANGVPFLQSGTWNGTTTNSVQAFKNGNSAGAVAYVPGTVGDNGSTWIGSGDGANTDWCFNGHIAEIAVFNTGLSVANNNKVMSYLAVKYGLTLGINYSNSAGTTIYSTAAAYTNNIIGITRDDGSGLTQKQSKNVDDSTRIYLSTLAASNSANGGSFATDLSHVMVGANAGYLCAAGSTSAEIPGGFGLVKRLDREWKVTNTNFAGTFSMDFKLNASAFPGSVNVSHLRLMIDDDGNFAAGTNTAVASGAGGITITYANPVITVSGISTSLIASGATKFITIGSINAATPLPITLKNFYAAKEINFNSVQWESESELNFSHYELERSTNGIDFIKIATVLSQKNKSEAKTLYKFDDYSFSSVITYYKLKMIDIDGSVEYSKLISITNKNNTLDLKIFPNPTNNGFYLSGNVSQKEIMTLDVLNLIGERIYTQLIDMSDESHGSAHYIDLKNLASGIYFINVTNNLGANFKEKLILKN